MSVILQTSLGNIVIDLHISVAPVECTNFIKLCKAKYYTFAPIYNIQKDYVAEFGDPLYPISKEGQSVWNLADSTRPKAFKVIGNKFRNTERGAVSFLTWKGEGTIDEYATSTVTITLKDLDERRSDLRSVVFGRVTEGIDILDKINSAIVDDQYRPYQDIRIHRAYILEDPFAEIDGLNIPRTPEPTELQLSTVRLDDMAQVNVDESGELTEEELRRKRQREAESKALTLELIGDLPSAEVKPMENVLFVCKLNAVTRDEDLEIIFSRFGKIVSCEVVRDKDTGESMQYAFVEYEDKRNCEAAYLKMDGVLIDDRRIHVDFSQSVSKLADAWRSNTNRKRREALGTSQGHRYRDPSSNSQKQQERSSYRSSRDDRGRSHNDRRMDGHRSTYNRGGYSSGNHGNDGHRDGVRDKEYRSSHHRGSRRGDRERDEDRATRHRYASSHGDESDRYHRR